MVAMMPWLLAILLNSSLGLALGEPGTLLLDQSERLAVLETKMMALEEENKYLRTKSLKTCEDLRTSPYNETGFYSLDPDGSGRPVDFYCDMDKGVTEVGHDHERAENVTWCRGEGCFSLPLTYTVPMAQIEALIAMSQDCHQEIKFECKLAPLKNPAFGVKFGWWTDQRDEKKYYFDGANETSEICDVNTNEGVCNCDMSLVPLWNSDHGKITNKNSLPIKEFHYGGFFNEHQAARITIGKLRCSGKSQSSAALLSTCSSLKKSGLSSNGFYLTKDSPSDSVSARYCQLSSPGYKEEELRMGENTPLGARTQEFVFGQFTRLDSRQYNQWYKITETTLTPNNTASFEFDGTSLTLKKTGVFLICVSNGYIRISIKGSTDSDSKAYCKTMSVMKLGENDKITFYTLSNYYTNVENSKLTITTL